MTSHSPHELDVFKNVSRETFARLEIYHALLLKWQKAINLVSAGTLEEAWARHFADSAQLAQYIPAPVKTIADLGSGAGFPGLVLAMMRPDLEVHLIESDERKAQFLRTVARETSTPIILHNSRVEEVSARVRGAGLSCAEGDVSVRGGATTGAEVREPEIEEVREAGAREAEVQDGAEIKSVSPDFITARALADLSQLCAYCAPWAAANPVLEMLFLKGAQAENEIVAARAHYDFELTRHPSKTAPEGTLLHIKKLKIL